MSTRTHASLEERFARMTAAEPDENGCLLWQGPTVTGGYGIVNVGTRTEGQKTAHRVAWELAYGDIPDGKYVCHSCDRRACVNPQHLWIGDNALNLADRDAKGRQAKGMTHGMSKLTDDKVRAIRLLHDAGMTYRRLAAMFDVSVASVRLVATGKTWKHVPQMEVFGPVRKWGRPG